MNGIQSPTLRSTGFAPLLVAGGVIVAIALVAGIALGSGGGGRGGDGGVAPPASEAPTPSPIVTPSPAPSDEPSEEPSEQPSEAPSEAPTEEPSEAPTDGGSDGMPIKVDLDNATGHDVYVDVVDRSGWLLGAESGSPGEGTSVDAYAVVVENVDERTLRLTWIDYPIDNALALFIDEVDGGLRFVLVQPEPTGDTDAMGFDRELILTFDRAISADQVEAFLQDGLDVAG
ncbi:MAG TPA: PT domain-containing protein [Candidatus Limnocylindrales bacterium]|nr:PT domain-containing protein [Candidatus Limnocylindrales bacterium]